MLTCSPNLPPRSNTGEISKFFGRRELGRVKKGLARWWVE
jgi:hypothetical protein